ncbi:MAG TPA: SRPBCC domain-containing protein [Candidatus Paceibacterota bacterium]|nr:SRPBCC domain-containing protein [Candidatus Paceibacterota bacterium]
MKKIQIETTVSGSLEKVWAYWNEPEHITKWAFASDEWECPYAENDLKEGGKFLTRMSAKDGSASFDLTGTYTVVIPQQKLGYSLDDGRPVFVAFEKLDNDRVRIVQEFEMENENSEEVQRNGWQEILNNFKKHAENN